MQIMSLGEHYILHLHKMSESNSIVAKVLIRFHEMIIIWGHKQRKSLVMVKRNLNKFPLLSSPVGQ